MTENGQVTETGLQNQNQNVSSVTPSSTPNVSQPRTYTEEEVNRIVGAKKDKAYEKGYESGKSEYSQNTNGSNNYLSADQLREIAKAEAIAAAKAELQQQQQAMQTQYQQMHRQKFVNDFVAKMQAGAKKHEDFETVVSSLQLQSIPDHLLELANSFDNTADIMYDLGNNHVKVANFITLARETPHLAYSEMQKLSQSIKKNDEAKSNQKNVSEPLSQIQPSTIGSDNGPKTVQDWKNQPWLRG
jgi:hypothetical protein